MKRFISSLLTLSTGFIMALSLPLAAKAATTVVATPNNTQGWTTDDTRPGGAVQYIYDPSSPMPDGALQLITDSSTTAKAQYMHPANTALSDITALGYHTRQLAASNTSVGDPSFQLPVCLGGLVGTTCTGFTTFVYEPYQNGTVTPGTWQNWDVAAGQFWSSKTYDNGSGCAVTAGAGGAPFYTLADLTIACPNATVTGYGANIGTNNPSYVVETDGIIFNDTTYDFQLSNPPTANSCKNGGFANFTDENGNPFRNQGQCIAYVSRGAKVLHFTTNSVRVHNNNKQNASSGNANSNNNTSGGNAQSGNASNNNNTTNNVNTGNF